MKLKLKRAIKSLEKIIDDPRLVICYDNATLKETIDTLKHQWESEYGR